MSRILCSRDLRQLWRKKTIPWVTDQHVVVVPYRVQAIVAGDILYSILVVL